MCGLHSCVTDHLWPCYASSPGADRGVGGDPVTHSLYRTFLDIPPELTGRGTCIAIVDGDFRPHPDIASTERRTTRFVRAADEAPEVVRFEDASGPWPGGAHGLWAAAVAAGTGAGAGGRYAGAAPDADLLLVAGWRPGLPTDQNHARIARALHWLLDHWRDYAVRAVVTAVTPEADPGILPWPCDPVRLVGEALAAEGLLVVGGAGNVPDLTARAAPAGAPSVLAVGGAVLSDGGFRERAVWDPTCNGETFDGRRVPDLLGPATGCVVPVAPGGEGMPLWEPLGDGYARASGGTSDAGPSVLGAAACVWRAHPDCPMKTVVFWGRLRSRQLVRCGKVTLNAHHVFLAEMDGDAELRRLDDKARGGVALTSGDIVNLAMLPLMHQERPMWDVLRVAAPVADILDPEMRRGVMGAMGALAYGVLEPAQRPFLLEVLR